MSNQSKNEIWRKCVAPFTRYEVSNMGRVRNSKLQVMKPLKQNTGYLRVTLYHKGINRILYIHRLVALSFCDGYLPGLVVDHKNGIRDDNRAENLRWVTISENASSAIRPNFTPILYFKDGQTAPVGIYTNCAALQRVEGGAPSIHLNYNMKFHGGRIQPITREQYNKIIGLMQQHWTLRSAWVEVMTELNL